MRLLVLAIVATSSCAEVIHDQQGNYYPAACTVPLTKMLADAGYPEVLHENREGYLAGVRVDGKIFISPELKGWRYDDALRHELCHKIAGPWHD